MNTDDTLAMIDDLIGDRKRSSSSQGEKNEGRPEMKKKRMDNFAEPNYPFEGLNNNQKRQDGKRMHDETYSEDSHEAVPLSHQRGFGYMMDDDQILNQLGKGSHQEEEEDNKSYKLQTKMMNQDMKKEVEEEYERVVELSTKVNSSEMHKTFTELQAMATAHNIRVDFPELVVVGMQSDGKSSFVEALCGFQFNLIDSNIGTRRPLILQMFNDPSHPTPKCTFYSEDLKYLENEPTAVRDIVKVIQDRTNNLCGPYNVSARPIMIKVEYKYASNITIYDMPGFRKGEDDPLAPRILKMAEFICKRKKSVIVCLEQSTVEWCNTQCRPIVQQFDPNFERTLFVSTKFNNRNNQFQTTKECNKYIEGDGLLFKKNLFFMSLPSGPTARSLSSEQFKNEIIRVHMHDYETLMHLNFNRNYKKFIGFFNIREHLQQLLQDRYHESVLPVSKKLRNEIEKREVAISKLKNELNTIEQDKAKDLLNKMVTQFVSNVNAALTGTTRFDPSNFGMTLTEELNSSGVKQWPSYDLKIPIRNEGYKLYGGSQFERLLSEFEVVAHAQEFPQTSNDEVAVSIGINPHHTKPDWDRGATDLAQRKSRMVFRPLLDILILRAKYIMDCTFNMIRKHMASKGRFQSKHKCLIDLIFDTAQQFIREVLDRVREKTDDEFDTFTKIIDWSLISFDDLKSPPTVLSSQSNFENSSSQQQQQDIGQLRTPVHSNMHTKNMQTKTPHKSAVGPGPHNHPYHPNGLTSPNQQRSPSPGHPAMHHGGVASTRTSLSNSLVLGSVHYNILDPSPDDTARRVKRMTESDTSYFQFFSAHHGRSLTDEGCVKIKLVAARLFAGIRSMFVKYIRAKFNTFFLTPIFEELDSFIRCAVCSKNEDDLKQMMGVQVGKLKKYHEDLLASVESLKCQEMQFLQVASRLQGNASPSSHRHARLSPV